MKKIWQTIRFHRLGAALSALTAYLLLTGVLGYIGLINPASLWLIGVPGVLLWLLLLSRVNIRLPLAHFMDGDRKLTVAEVIPLRSPFAGRRRGLYYGNGGAYSVVPLGQDKSLLLMRYFQAFTELYHPERLPRALVLGVAGGSLVHYLADRYPECRVTGVELSPGLVELAEKYFFPGIPRERFELIVGDAVEFVKQPEPRERFDAVYCDLFCNSQPLTAAYDDEFFTGLEHRLATDGIVMLNLLNVTPDALAATAAAAARQLGFAEILTRGGGAVMICGRPESRQRVCRLLHRRRLAGTVHTIGLPLPCRDKTSANAAD